jgi:hypothetical protein
VLADGSYCGTIGHVDVASQTFDFQAWTSTGPSGVTELAGATSVLTPTDTTFTVASDIGGPPTASPTQTVLQGWLKFLAEAVSAEPDATYDITQDSGNVTSLYFKDPRYSEAGATEYHGCVSTSG